MSHQWYVNYHNYVYELRNLIAHKGHNPTKKEIDKAFIHEETYRNFLIKKVHRTSYDEVKKLLTLRGRKMKPSKGA